MNLTDLITSRANVTISITAGELATFANDLVEKTRRSLEVSIAEEQSEVFYSKDQVCRILSINPSTLWNWDKRANLRNLSEEEQRLTAWVESEITSRPKIKIRTPPYGTQWHHEWGSIIVQSNEKSFDCGIYIEWNV